MTYHHDLTPKIDQNVDFHAKNTMNHDIVILRFSVSI